MKIFLGVVVLGLIVASIGNNSDLKSKGKENFTNQHVQLDNQVEYKKYINSKFKYEIEYPENWGIAQEMNNKEGIKFYDENSPKNAITYINAYASEVVKNSENESVDKLKEKEINSIKKDLQNISEIQLTTNQEIQGLIIKGNKGQEKVWYFTLFKDNVKYIIYVADRNDEIGKSNFIAQNEEILMNVAKTLKVKE